MPKRPQWKIWGGVPEVTLIEGVALSLDIDPREIGHVYNHGKQLCDRFGVPLSGEKATEGAQRLIVANRNLGNKLPLTPTSNFGLFGAQQVSLPQFAAWASSQGWSIPGELMEIADIRATSKPRSSNRAQSDCKTWLLAKMKNEMVPKNRKAQYQEEAKQLFPGLSQRGFIGAWRYAVGKSGNLAWSTPGRKSGRRIDTSK